MKILCLIMCFLITGCSYVMNSLEEGLTSRAGFSINVSYDKSTNYLNISWPGTTTEEGFAGYEIYMIPTPWNEFGTYDVIAAHYDIQSSTRFFRRISSLGDIASRTASIRMTSADLEGEGEYYVRVGIIKMTKDKDSEDNEYYPVTFTNYIEHSVLSSISGYRPVYIY